VRSDVLRHELTQADAEVAAALEIAEGAPVVILTRLRHVDDDAWSLSTTWMPQDVGGITLGADLRDASLYALLADHGITATHGVRSAEATVATHEQAGLLGVSAGSALLRLRSVSRDGTGHPIEFFIAYHRGDRSRFEFQLGPDSAQGALVPIP
jgi:GntR family transcriptional regulator